MLLFVLYDIKMNILGGLDSWSYKTSNLKKSPWAVGNYKEQLVD